MVNGDTPEKRKKGYASRPQEKADTGKNVEEVLI
jgi:hypothetical protein